MIMKAHRATYVDGGRFVYFSAHDPKTGLTGYGDTEREAKDTLQHLLWDQAAAAAPIPHS